MVTRSPSAVHWVQAMQALTARELVEAFGLPESHAARLLGVVPSAVSQYLSGRRAAGGIARYLADPGARKIARGAAQELMAATGGRSRRQPVIEAAARLAGREANVWADRGSVRGPSRTTPVGPELPRRLRGRIAGEQRAVSDCMQLAQRSRDELTRALFRQIASDSLRHAEIVASLASYLDRGVSTSVPTGIRRRDVDRLIEREHAAEGTDSDAMGRRLGGVMRILWESMEADERKHERLLALLLKSDLLGSDGSQLGEGKPGLRSRPRRAPRVG